MLLACDGRINGRVCDVACHWHCLHTPPDKQTVLDKDVSWYCDACKHARASDITLESAVENNPHMKLLFSCFPDIRSVPEASLCVAALPQHR